MLIRTKKYVMSKRRYLRLGRRRFLRKQGMLILLAYAVLNLGVLWMNSWWWLIASTMALVAYVGFRFLQFNAVLYMEQSKLLFERFSYEIDTKQILLRRNAREGIPLPWEKVKAVSITQEAFILYLSAVQLIDLPRKIFQTAHDQKVFETILSRKGF